MHSVYLAALAGTVAAQLAPGPNLLAVASVALGQGRSAALCVAAGVASGVLLWVAAFAFGISSLFEAYPVMGIALQFAGGSYFLFVALRAIRSARQVTANPLTATATQTSLPKAYRRGLLVVLTNPKAAMMWAAVTAFLSGSGLSTTGVMSFAPVGSLSALIVYASYGYLFSTTTAIRGYARISRQLEYLFGTLFGLLGIKFMIDGVREIRSL